MSAHAIALKNAGRRDYTSGVVRHPVAVLNTLGNTLEFRIAGKVIDPTEHKRLPGILVWAWSGRSTESGSGTADAASSNSVGPRFQRSCSSVEHDVTGVFDNVSPNVSYTICGKAKARNESQIEWKAF